MCKQVSMSESYSLMNVAGLILIEDALSIDTKRTSVLYDFLRVNHDDQLRFIEEIQNADPSFANKFKNIINFIEKTSYSFNWDLVPDREIEFYLEQKGLLEIKKLVDVIAQDEIENNVEIISRFGFGLKENTPGYTDIIKSTMINNNRLPIRIYKEFTVQDQSNLERDIKYFSSKDSCFVCVVDDQLGLNLRGKEIISFLCQNEYAQQSAICILLSSKSNEDVSKYSKEIYIEYIHKDDTELLLKTKSALYRSQYSIMLRRLKKIKMQAVEKSYEYALENPNTAYYLSSMAEEEGTTTYEVLSEWLNIRENYFWSKNNTEDIISIVLLSSLINGMQASINEAEIDVQNASEIRTYENFDYAINNFHLPPMAGDIYYINGNYYLLVGQDCDFSIRNGKRNNALYELLPIEIVSKFKIGSFKEKISYEKILLSDFNTIESKNVTIKIDCTKREFIDNEVLDLCAFDPDGHASLLMDTDLSIKIQKIISEEWRQYYSKLQEKLSNLIKFKEFLCSSGKEYSIDFVLDNLGYSHAQRLISIVNFDFSSATNGISYPVKRMCRIKNHMLLINKLYLEYRGRQAFNTINMDIARPISYLLKCSDLERDITSDHAVAILTNKRSENDPEKVKNRDWIVNVSDIKSILSDANYDWQEFTDGILLETDTILLKGKEGLIDNTNLKFLKSSNQTNDILTIIPIQKK